MVERANDNPLSERELELLRLVATGATNPQIAQALFISVNTVKVHLRNIFEKLGVESRTEATLVAIRAGWVVVEGTGEPAETPQPTDVASLPMPAVPRITLGQRIFLLVSAVVALGLAFVPPLSAQLAQSRSRSPFTERSMSAPLLVADERATRWTTMPAMSVARGRLAGAFYDEKIYAIGGDTDDGVTGVTEAYDLATNRWAILEDKPTPVGNVAAAVAAGRIWAPGGFLADGRITTVVEAYDPELSGWVQGPPLPQPVCAYALAALDDQLYLFGGANNQGYLGSAYRLDVEAGTWQTLAPMSTPRAFAAAAVLEGVIYVVGGYDGQQELTLCEVYDPAAEAAGQPAWRTCPSLMTGRGGLGLAVVGTTLYAVGGGWEEFLAFNEQYEPAERRWTSFSTPVSGEWRNLAAVSDGQRVYVFGGWDGNYLSTLRAYQAVVTIFLPITP